MRLADSLRPHEQQPYRSGTWKLIDESFRAQLGHFQLLRPEFLGELEVLEFTMRISGRNSRIRNQAIDTSLPEAIAPLHAGNTVLDEMNPTGPITLRTTRNTSGIDWFPAHGVIVHDLILL